MIRYALLWSYVLAVMVTSLKNWFIALCMLIPILAVIERPDMPREIAGISGLNPLNLMLLFILLGWYIQRKKDHLEWTLPTSTNKLLIIYIGLMALSVMRLFLDIDAFKEFPPPNPSSVSFVSLLKNEVINSIKYMALGLLLLHGINSRDRMRLAIRALLAFGFLLSLQTIAKMLPALLGSDDLATRALRVLDRDIGYHRVNIAAMTAGFSWAFFVLIRYSRTQVDRIFGQLGFLVSGLALILSGGRAGLLAWVGCGVFFALIKYRKLLLIGPLLAIVVIGAIPGFQDRLQEGFDEDSHETSIEDRGLDVVDDQGRDLYAITSGRVIAWPLVIENISNQPLIGYGRRAMQRLGLHYQIAETIGTNTLAFGHPHNAYLELFLEHGLIAGIIILALFVSFTLKAVLVFFKDEDKDLTLAAGISIAFLVTQAISSLGSQHFFPTIGTAHMWMGIGVFYATMAVVTKTKVEEIKEAEIKVKRPKYYS